MVWKHDQCMLTTCLQGARSICPAGAVMIPATAEID